MVSAGANVISWLGSTHFQAHAVVTDRVQCWLLNGGLQFFAHYWPKATVTKFLTKCFSSPEQTDERPERERVLARQESQSFVSWPQKWHPVTFAVLYSLEATHEDQLTFKERGITQGCDFQAAGVIGSCIRTLPITLYYQCWGKYSYTCIFENCFCYGLNCVHRNSFVETLMPIP